jgi:hypothetical protein
MVEINVQMIDESWLISCETKAAVSIVNKRLQPSTVNNIAHEHRVEWEKKEERKENVFMFMFSRILKETSIGF